MYNSFDLKKDTIEQNKHQLQGVDLSGRDLGGINLGWAKLQNSKLNGAFLCGHVFEKRSTASSRTGRENRTNTCMADATSWPIHGSRPLVDIPLTVGVPVAVAVRVHRRVRPGAGREGPARAILTVVRVGISAEEIVRVVTVGRGIDASGVVEISVA